MNTHFVGFIGAGKMGGPIATALLDNAVPVRLWARNEGVARSFCEAGATVVSTPTEVAEYADTVVVCLFGDQHVYDIILAQGGVLDQMTPGSLLVIHSTIEIATLRDIDEKARSRGVLTLDAPLVGTPKDIISGRLITLLAGTAQAVTTGRELTELYSGQLIETGLLGSATLNKLINNAPFAANPEMALAALDLADRLGLDPQVSMEVLKCGSASSNAIQEIANAPSPTAFKQSATPYFEKDTAAARASASLYGQKLGDLDAALARVDGASGRVRVSTPEGSTEP